ncbi:9351_t:CDS:2, partial [Racocetra persica]
FAKIIVLETLKRKITNLVIESVRQSENINYDTIPEANINNITYVEIDCLNIENLIEQKINELTPNEYSNITSDMIAKNIAAIIITKIESSDDYL